MPKNKGFGKARRLKLINLGLRRRCSFYLIRRGSGCPSGRSCHREDRIGTPSPAWPSGIVSSEVPGSFEDA